MLRSSIPRSSDNLSDVLPQLSDRLQRASSIAVLTRAGILAVLALCFLSCAYFNTFYNAKKYFDEAEKELAKVENRSQLSKKTIDALDKTIEKSSVVLQKYPQSRYRDDALLLKGKALCYKGDYLKAINSFERLIKEVDDTPFSLEAEIWILRCKWKLGDREETLEQLRQLLGEMGEEELALGHEMAAEMYMEEGEVDSAIHHYGESAEHVKGAAERSRLYFRIADIAFNESRYGEALNFYRRLIRLSGNPEHIERAHLQIVRITRYQKRWEDTTVEIQKLLSDDKFRDIYPDLYMELAKLYEMQSRSTEAKNRYELVTQEFPRTESSAEAYYRLGQLALATSEDYDEARKYFGNVEKESRRSVFAPSARVKAKEIDGLLRVLEEIEGLEQSLTQAKRQTKISVAEEDTVTGAQAADSLLLVTETDSSFKNREMIMHELAEKLYSYGELLAFHFDQPDTSIRVFERLVMDIPGSPKRAQALFSLSYLYDQKDDSSKAMDYARLLMKEYPFTEYAEKVSTSLGTGIADRAEQILEEAEKLSQMDPQKAIEVYQRVLFEYPTSRFVPHALMAVANSYDTRLNDLENSLIFYERLMQDFPASEQARFVEARYQELRRLQESFADTSRTTAVDTDEN